MAVINTETPLSTARIVRNKIHYKQNTGIVDINVDVKNYVKSVATSPQYKLISNLKFTSNN